MHIARLTLSLIGDSESGTDYAMHRQHQFANGRFMRPDAVAGSTSNPQSLNRYAYTNNDPVNLVDPFGLNSEIPGYCPPEFPFCGEATVRIPGVGYTNVTVGYDGSGGGTFLWDTSRGRNSFLGRLEMAGVSLSRLPFGFSKSARYSVMVTRRRIRIGAKSPTSQSTL